MTAGWEPVRQQRTHELVLENIEQQVMAGKLHAGDRLPPERQLAPALGVSRSALREALRVLEAFGLLTAHTGRGADAGATITTDPTDAVGRMLRLHLALGSYRIEDILEARVMLERCSVTEAARHADPTQLDEAQRLLDAMVDPQLAVEDFSELDTRFHVQLARCSGNELTRTLTAAVRESIRPVILDALQGVADWAGTADTLRAEHREILRQVRAGDADAAARSVEQHIRGFHGHVVNC